MASNNVKQQTSRQRNQQPARCISNNSNNINAMGGVINSSIYQRKAASIAYRAASIMKHQ